MSNARQKNSPVTLTKPHEDTVSDALHNDTKVSEKKFLKRCKSIIEPFFDAHFLGSFLSYCLLWLAVGSFLSFHEISNPAFLGVVFFLFYITPLIVFSFILSGLAGSWIYQLFPSCSLGNAPVLMILLCIAFPMTKNEAVVLDSVWIDALIILLILSILGRSLHDALLLCKNSAFDKHQKGNS